MKLIKFLLFLVVSLGLSAQLSYGMNDFFSSNFNIKTKIGSSIEAAQANMKREFKRVKKIGKYRAENTYAEEKPIKGLFGLYWKKEVITVKQFKNNNPAVIHCRHYEIETKIKDCLKTKLLKAGLGLTGLAGVGYYFYKNPTLVSSFQSKLVNGWNYFFTTNSKVASDSKWDYCLYK
jgi:hypothetical protein